MTTRLLRASLLALCFVTAMASLCRSVEVGESMPEFAIGTFNGASTSNATLKGKPLLLIFWNTWCPKCMKELPEIKRLHEAYGPKGLAVLAVNTAMNDAESKARAYWDKYGYGFPGGFDRYFETGQAFGVFAVPTVLLIDSKGVVRYKQAGLPEDVEDRIKLMIEAMQCNRGSHRGG
jgi:thiol-disulfide isomerase/thioredoxin